MIAIVDYGAGNIFSVKNALDFLGLESQLTDDAAAIQAADAHHPAGCWSISECNADVERTKFGIRFTDRVQKEAVFRDLPWDAADF